MAHSRIFQITEKKIDEDQYINEDFDPQQWDDFADFIEEIGNPQKSLEWFDDVFEGIFTRNGRELTLLDITDFMEDWLCEIKRTTDISVDGMREWRFRYNLSSLLRHTHRNIDFHFVLDEDGLEIDNAGGFINNLYSSYKPGNKFYIGGILDYHF